MIYRPRFSTVAEAPPAAEAAPADAAVEEPTDTQAELRNWIKDNASLLSNASLLISVSALALNLLPTTGVLDPYIKALIFGAALLLLIEMHHQWPVDLQLHKVRGIGALDSHSWRMMAFAFIMQVATLVFVVWATLTNPLILIPLTALAVIFGFHRWYFRRFHSVGARVFGIFALIALLVLSEVLMVIVWAVLTDGHVTIDVGADPQPFLNVQVWN